MSEWDHGARPGLPAAPALVGRDDDLARLEALLASPGLVTLTGLAGVGTSAVARVLAERHGAPLCDLATGEGRQRFMRLGTSMAESAAAGSPGQEDLAEIANRKLLVIDHADGRWPLVEGALAGAAEVGCSLSVLATARRRSRLAGERSYHLSGLALERRSGAESRCDATTALRGLLEQRAPWLEIDAVDAELLDEMARRLDGNPRALTDAADRVALLGCSPVLVSLGEVLMVSDGTRPSIDAALAELFDELEPRHHRLLGALAPAPGPLGIATIEAVHPDPGVLTSLTELVELGLVNATQHESLAVFALNALVRLAPSAADRLVVDTDAWFALALAHYRSGTGQLTARAHHTRRPAHVREILAESDTVFATLGWALDRDLVEEAAEVAVALAWTWHHGGVLKQGRVWSDRIEARLRALPEQPRRDLLRSRLLVTSASFERRLSGSVLGENKAREALALASRHHDPVAEGMALQACAAFATSRGEYLLAGQYVESARERFREVGGDVMMATTVLAAGRQAESQGRADTALGHYRQAAQVFRLYDEPTWEAVAEHAAASLLVAERRAAEAAELLVRAIECALLARVDALGSSLLTVGGAILAAHHRDGQAMVAVGAASAIQDPLHTYAVETARNADRAAGYLARAAEQIEPAERARMVDQGAGMDLATALRWLHDAVTDCLPSPAERFTHDPVLVEAEAAARALAELSRREREVLDQLHRGLSNEAISQRLGVSRRTVDKHVERIFRKLGVRSRTAAIYLLTTAAGHHPDGF